MSEQQRKWDERYRNDGNAVAAEVLRDNLHLLPASGTALDLACGLGGNALLLAAAGLDTHAWDISPLAIAALEAEAKTRGLPVQAEVHDVLATPPKPAAWDVIVVSHFLERSLALPLCAALKPGGLLFYQTFTRIKAVPGGPSNPAYLLEDNELLALFSALRLRVYREENMLGDVPKGLRNQALLIAQKPA